LKADRFPGDRPIRISPNMLMFPRPSALRDIYWNPRLNQKSRLYGSGALGPPHLFTTLDGEEHKQLRKALSNAPWTIGPLKNTWEYKFDKLVSLFVQKLAEHAAEKRVVCVSDKLAEFASDLMSMITFGTPFGCVENQRDEKSMLHNWRQGLDFFGFAGRFRFFRDHIIPLPVVGLWFLPSTSNHSGMGWLLREADSQVSAREEQLSQGTYQGEPDFMQQ
jgi:cytochrome P450